jgi:adenine-specific DNA glycosylase
MIQAKQRTAVSSRCDEIVVNYYVKLAERFPAVARIADADHVVQAEQLSSVVM